MPPKTGCTHPTPAFPQQPRLAGSDAPRGLCQSILLSPIQLPDCIINLQQALLLLAKGSLRTANTNSFTSMHQLMSTQPVVSPVGTSRSTPNRSWGGTALLPAAGAHGHGSLGTSLHQCYEGERVANLLRQQR